jgi:hypothetical protein
MFPVIFVDENLQEIDFDDPVDLVCISMMLTIQCKRGWEIADPTGPGASRSFSAASPPCCMPRKPDAACRRVFLGEAGGPHGRRPRGFHHGDRLQPVYDFQDDRPPSSGWAPPAGTFWTGTSTTIAVSRWSTWCTPPGDVASTATPVRCLPGRQRFRPRPIDKTIAEMAAIDNNRLFIVDNSLAQDTEWEKRPVSGDDPLKKKWCSHPIEDNPKVLDLAAQAGAWYVYQAVFDTSTHPGTHQRYHDYGIGVEGTILLGLDEHTEDDIKRLVDFLLEIELDLAEFTVLTPFPHTRVYRDLHEQKRILTYDWDKYTADQVVFQPRHMSPEKLQELLDYAWKTFYHDEPQRMKMFKLMEQVMRREQADGTYRPRNRKLARQAFGRKI